jgi:hypothetical protein
MSAAIGAAYYDAFRSSAVTPAPYFAIAAYGSVASSQQAALQEWQRYSGGATKVEPSFAGTPDGAADQLRQLATRYGADEAFIDCFAASHDMRLDGLRSLSDALGLSKSSGELTGTAPFETPNAWNT